MKTESKEDKKEKKTTNKLGFSIDKLMQDGDGDMDFINKIERSRTYAKTLLWLAHIFFEKKQERVTNKEFSYFIKKIPQQTTQILEVFVMHDVIGCHKRGHFKETIYFLKDGETLRTNISLAKKTLRL